MATKLERRHVERLIFRSPTALRFTQDTPVLPDVWIAYIENPDGREDLILTPEIPFSAGQLAADLRERIKVVHEDELAEIGIAYNQASVVAELTFEQLVQYVLPMSRWWQKADEELRLREAIDLYRQALEHERGLEQNPESKEVLRTFSMYLPMRLAHMVLWTRGATEPAPQEAGPTLKPEPIYPPAAELLATMALLENLLAGVSPVDPDSLGKTARVFSVNRNREVNAAVERSVPAIKADAAVRLFQTTAKDIRWAVLDSGIDARHPAFRDCTISDPHVLGDWRKSSRVVATYDFTIVRRILSPDRTDWAKLPGFVQKAREEEPETYLELKRRLERGLDIDWSLLLPFITVPHEDGKYADPYADHGTHVAGILGACWLSSADTAPPFGDVRGVCPDIRLIDVRVFDVGTRETEFAVMAAMQYLRYRNANSDALFVHGANMSFSIRHDVSNYACGQTPVCQECQRLVNAGIVVVAAAGNEGHLRYQTEKGLKEGYFSVSITDPGNADAAITVGSTHRFEPHNYGVSYFSSRGPTGDGRMKPDLVAPGEKIQSVVASERERLVTMDGTSMAAPHVSGAAALLLSRHRELIGRPDKVKRILCATATDLGRERYFQGAGMVDVLRAIQSV